MGHPILDHEKAEADRDALRKKKSTRSNDAPARKPLRARKPDVIKGNPPAHGENDEDRGREDIIGNE